MKGAILGDIIGSRFEFNKCQEAKFELFHKDCSFTDDTICSVATMDWLMREPRPSYSVVLREWCNKFPHPMGGYGGRFSRWLVSQTSEPYGSCGNGSAMRVSPVAYWSEEEDGVLALAERTAEVTHNHTEGIKGAQATALAIFLARKGKSKKDIKRAIEDRFSYDLSRTYASLKDTYEYTELCQETVPEALIAFLESSNFYDAIRKAVLLGGDSDTLACITGSIAEAFYGLPENASKTIVSYTGVGPLFEKVSQFYQTLHFKNHQR